MIKQDLLLRAVIPAPVLAAGVFAGGFSPLAWATGAVYALALVLLTEWGLRRSGRPRRGRRVRRSGRPAFGPADWITFARALLVGCAAELVAEGDFSLGWVVALVGVALLLDGLDGQVVRSCHVEAHSDVLSALPVTSDG